MNGVEKFGMRTLAAEMKRGQIGLREAQFILWFREIGIEDVPRVGGKNASLGEMYWELTPKGVQVPNGFAITAAAYRNFIQESQLDDRIGDLLERLDTRDLQQLRAVGREIGREILGAKMPIELEKAILPLIKTGNHSAPFP